jgi:uncharacterized Zn finger protein
MSRYDYSEYPPYVPVAQRKVQNRKAVAKLRKANPSIQPLVIEGRSIAESWWGKSWNKNLERYADYSNRIGRGRSYVRHGSVLDLQVAAGEVRALVQGSERRPYDVSIMIKALPAKTWETLKGTSLKQVDSLGDLLAGRFPKALKDTFFAQGTGLFPTPGEIAFGCSCPDRASMCKHVAAVLYGIGNRLDESPELLFTLRGVTVDDLIERTVEAATAGLLSKAERAAGDEVLADADLGDVFGIEFEDGDMAPIKLPAPTPPKAKPRKKVEAKPAKVRKRAGKAKGAAKTTKRKRKVMVGKPVRGKMVEQLVTAVDALPVKFTNAKLARLLPEWSAQQVTNTLQRALREGAVIRIDQGVYRRA